jgi:NOL1/NOP2/sun family putative RNA methylase
MMMLPIAYLDRMKGMLGEEYDSFMAHYGDPPSVGLRVNTLKLNPQTFATLWPEVLSPIPWTQSGFTLPPDSRPGKHPYHAAGLYYLQDPAAMAVAEVLDPQPGERVLDLSAAPGGKSTHLAAKLGDQGLLVANDIHPRRVKDLAKNLERWGTRNTIILNETPSRLAEHFGAYFDKVLVDAPCSGEGMFRKDPAARQEWTPKLVESCAIRQDGIMRDAARLVRPGGRLAYATCTFAPEEDEGTVTRFLQEHPDFQLVDIAMPDGRVPEFTQQIEASYPPAVARTLRLWPHKVPGEGHFVALFQRLGNAYGDPVRLAAANYGPVPKEAASYLHSFLEDVMNWRPSMERLALHGTYLYQLPERMPELSGLRVIHWGFWLGMVKVKRFEPSHALALGLTPGDFQQVIDLTAADARIMAYLHGEVLPIPGPDGWVLVAVDGFPVGWGKRVQNRVKSHSPKWLRWI